MARPTPQEVEAAQVVLNYLGSSSDHSAYAVASELGPYFRAILAENERLVEALAQITRGEGRFSLDHKQHAINTIEDMKELARAALAETEKGNT